MKDIKRLKTKNVWWIANPPKKVESTFSTELIALLNNTSMHCYAKIVEANRTFWEKLMWVIIHVLAFGALAVVLKFSIEQYIEKPLSTNLHNTIYPIESVPFPAVSICSNNRISKLAAQEYAAYLASLDPKKRGIPYFLENVGKMSALYDGDTTYLKDILEFQTFLDAYDVNETETFYNTRRRMYLMTPPCQYLLLKCTMAGEIVPCMAPSMFRMSITYRGYCCIFNVNETETLTSFIDKKTNRTKSKVGYDMGLTVVLNATTIDYFVTMFNLNGFVIHVYDPSKYDDLTSGVIAERFVARASEAFIRIIPQVIQSDNDIRAYKTSSRKCLFQDEYPGTYGNRYSLSNCITNCRIRSITSICGCVPFYMPRTSFFKVEDIPPCTLQHVQCLSRFKKKWLTVLTEITTAPGLEEEIENGLYCLDCLPSCSYIRYLLSMNTFPLTRYVSKESPLLTGTKNFSEVAVVHVYYTSSPVWFFKQRVTNPWFQILSNIGGICGIVTGFSIAAVCEIIYFIFNQLHYCRKKFNKPTETIQTLIIYP